MILAMFGQEKNLLKDKNPVCCGMIIRKKTLKEKFGNLAAP
jgi:hypothetical protein